MSRKYAKFFTERSPAASALLSARREILTASLAVMFAEEISSAYFPVWLRA